MSSQGGGEDRDARLKWSKRAEHHLRGELNYIARQQCDEVIRGFVDCSNANGLLVVLRCREHSKKSKPPSPRTYISPG